LAKSPSVSGLSPTMMLSSPKRAFTMAAIAS
jgi:hypothetical protein